MRVSAKASFGCIFLISLSVVSGCSKPGASSHEEQGKNSTHPQYGGRLVLSSVSDPKSFNPVLAKETSTTNIVNYVFDGLTTTSGVTLEVEPALASAWTMGSYGKEWLFHLREDARWADGTAFTADDVVFTFNDLIFNDSIPNSLRDIFTVEGKRLTVDKLDRHTVKFTLPTAFAPFLRAMSAPILPKHLLEGFVREGKFNSTWGVDTPVSQIVGTGPFQIQEYVSGQRVVLKRNPNYWKKDKKGRQLPFLDVVVFLIVPNQDVGFLKFQEGQIDFYDLRGADYPLLKPKEAQGNFTIYRTGPSFGSSFLVFNENVSKDPKTGKTSIAPEKLSWFTNPRFRQAIAHAIDKKSIIDIVYNGLAIPQDSSMSPSEGYFCTSDVTHYDYDLAMARNILAQEGFRDVDEDGFLEDPRGNTVEFSLYTNAGVTERVKMAEMIRKDVEKLGMKVSLVLVEFNTLVSKLSSTYDWDTMILGLTGGIEPHFGNNVWQSSGHLHLWYPRQKSPATPWEARIDEIFNKGVQEMDPAKRKTLYDEWQRIVSEQVSLIYTVLPESILAVRNKFGNLKPTPYGGALHNLDEIYILAREL